MKTPTRKYVQVAAGPALHSRGVNVVIRELMTTAEVMEGARPVEKVVSFAKFQQLQKAGLIEKPAFVPKEKR